MLLFGMQQETVVWCRDKQKGIYGQAAIHQPRDLGWPLYSLCAMISLLKSGGIPTPFH